MFTSLPPQNSQKIAHIITDEERQTRRYYQGKKSFKDSLYLLLNGFSQAAKSSVRFDSQIHKCQSQKATRTCAPGLKQNVPKTFYLLIGVTHPFRPPIPLDLHTHFLYTQKWPVMQQ